MADVKNISKVKGGAVLAALAAVAAVFGVQVEDAELNAAKDAVATIGASGVVLVAFGRKLWNGVVGALGKDE